MVVGWVGPKTANYQWSLIGGVNLVEVAVRLPPSSPLTCVPLIPVGVCARTRACAYGGKYQEPSGSCNVWVLTSGVSKLEYTGWFGFQIFVLI